MAGPMDVKGLLVVALALCLAACAGEPVAPVSSKTVLEKRFAAFNRRDLDAIVALYAPDAVEISPGFCSDRSGPEGARRTYGELFQAFPDITDEVTTYVVDDDHVAVEFVAHVGKPGAGFSFHIANFLTLEHGLIKRDVTYFDTKGRPCA